MTGAILSFSSMAVAGRELGGPLDTFEIMMYRSLIGLFIVALVLSVTGRWSMVSRASLGTHLIRNLAHFTGQNLWFFAVTVIPLAQVFALEFTTPLWVIVLSPLILGERMTPMRVLAALIGFAGVLAHFCLTNALAIAPATVVIPLDFVRLPAIAVVGMVMYGEPLDAWVLVGALVIFGGNYLNILMETRRKRAETP